jgi:hypothetical protein
MTIDIDNRENDDMDLLQEINDYECDYSIPDQLEKLYEMGLLDNID